MDISSFSRILGIPARLCFAAYLPTLELKLRRLGFTRKSLSGAFSEFSCYEGGRDGGHPPLVLIHGLGLYPEYRHPLMSSLRGSFKITALELLGFGRSAAHTTKLSGLPFEPFLDQVRTLQDHLGGFRCILVCVSLGGWIAVKYALDNPERVGGLVLAGAGGLGADISFEELEGLRNRFLVHSPQDVRRLINQTILSHPIPIPDVLALSILEIAKVGVFHPFLESLKTEDWIGRKALQIEAPTALVWGVKDRAFPMSTVTYPAAEMKQARIFRLGNTGHAHLVEHRNQDLRALVRAVRWVVDAFNESQSSWS